MKWIIPECRCTTLYVVYDLPANVEKKKSPKMFQQLNKSEYKWMRQN